MSSRRKQSKPKSFAINELDPTADTTVAATSVTTVPAVEVITNTPSGQNLAPIPTDLLAFNQPLALPIEQPQINTDQPVEMQIATSSETFDESNPNKRKRNEDEPEINTSNESENVTDQSVDYTNDLEDDFIEDLDITFANGQNLTQFNESNLNQTFPTQFQHHHDNNISLSQDIDSQLLMFKCKVCGKGFKHRRSLNRHVRLHSGEKNYKCPHCATAFARSDHLKAHIRTHNNSKPYRCSVCQCGYNTQAALKVHIAHHHSKSKFKCTLCNDLEFHSQLALEGHMYTKHSKPNTEIDLDTAMIQSSYSHKVNNITNDYNDYNKHEISTQQYQRIKLADINNYSKDTDEQQFNYMNNSNNLTNFNSENRENLNNSQTDINMDEYMQHDTSKEIYEELIDTKQTLNNQMETATFIDNYGEDDDEENHSDLSSTSLKQIDETDSDDIIIEENLSSKADTFKRLIPKIVPVAVAGIQNNGIKPLQKPLPTPPPLLMPGNRPLSQPVNKTVQRPVINNTYCEFCNARFSNVESYQAHMRNCHPSINIQQQQPRIINETVQPTKMPYLTSILTKTQSVPNLNNSINGTKVINEPTNGLIITNNGIIVTGNNTINKTTNNCVRPNCNCALSPNCQNRCSINNKAKTIDETNDQIDYYYAIKETHYTCSQCNLTLFKLNDYMTHLKQEHCVEVFRCILCKQMQLFDNLSLLKEHFFQEHQSHKFDYYRCRLCINPAPTQTGLMYSSLEELNTHLKTVHHVNTSSIPAGQVVKQPEMRIIQQQMPPPTLPPPPPPPPIQIPVQIQQQMPIYQPQTQQSSQHFQQFNQYDRFNTYSNKCFKCNYCDSDFAQQSYLNQHIQMVHGNKVNPVIPAPPPPPPAQSNYIPVQQTQQNVFSCQYCRNTFSNRSQLERHVRIHVSSIDLKCNICDQLFETQESLSQHKLTHCKTFNDVNKEPEQSAKQNGNGNGTDATNIAICVYCKQTIDNESVFKEHFKRHNNIGANNPGSKANSFICIVCRQTLTSNSEYNLHMRHHLRRSNQAITTTNANQPKPIQPTQQPAKQPETLKEDEQTDKTVTNKLKCSKCLVKFEIWQELADHIAEMHKEEPATTKAIEPAPEPVKEKVPVKQERKSPEPVPVQQEKEVKKIAEPINNHHITDMCEICSSKFDSNAKLQCHLLIKHEFVNNNNLFTCPVCDEAFSRPENLIQHTYSHGPAAKIYKCSKCSIAFVFKAQLINHSFSHHQSDNQRETIPVKRFIGNPPPQVTNVVYKNVNPMIRPRQMVPNHYPQQHQQQQVPYQNMNQRYRCNECNIEFNAFRFYQHHCQTVHNRTIIQNSYITSNIG